ncbi:MAG: IS1595 family transposase, partial [Balneolaceae bacterium]|nr:IS1595 family transposase [Balneolaceae bacterium]
MINRYYKRSRITEAKFRQLIRYFSMDFTASDVAKLTGLSRRSVTSIYVKLRHKIC